MKRSELKRHTPLKARQKPLQNITSFITAPRKAMRRTRSAPAANKAEQARWALMREIGCIACLMNQHRPDLAFETTGMALEHQHITAGGRRQGHAVSFELCRFHHQGDKFPMIEAGYKANALRYGPSFGKGRRPFAAVYGDDAELLDFQNMLITAAMEANHG